MKQYILPVLLWTLALSHAFAQQTLSPSAQQNLGLLPTNALKLLTKAGFVTAQSSNTLTADERTNPLQLDSTKTFVGYNVNAGQDSTPLDRTIYQYPQANKRIETNYQFVNDAWVPTDRSNITIDALEREPSAVSELFDNSTQTWVLDSRYQAFFHGDAIDKFDSLQVFDWDETLPGWALAFSVRNTYDAQNRLIISESTFDFDGQVALLRDVYSYNASGDNHLIESFIVSSGFELPSGKTELQYTNHLLIQEIKYASAGFSGFVPSDRVVYAYNANNKVKQQNTSVYMPGVNDWAPTQTQLFSYDAELRLSEQEIITTEPGTPEDKIRLNYVYKQDEKLALENIFVWEAGAYVLSDRKYYYYTAGSAGLFPTPGNVQSLAMFPNPGSGVVQLTLENEAVVMVFDASGKLMDSQVLVPGSSLNLSALPQGIYQIVATDNQARFTGRFIKQ